MGKRRNLKKRKQKKRVGGVSIGNVISWKVVLIPLLFAGIPAGLFLGGRCFFLGSEVFAIGEMAVGGSGGCSFVDVEGRLRSLYEGRNIFMVDLRQARMLIEKDYPQFKEVEVRRVLPDRLEVDITGREAAAVIDAAGGVVIDGEGIVLAVGEGEKGLVKIKGISFFLKIPAVGENLGNRHLNRALALLGVLGEKMGQCKKDIEYIDVSDRRNIVLGVSGATVKMGKDDLSGKIDQLKEMAEDPDVDMRDIKYIDLRFREPVISLR